MEKEISMSNLVNIKTDTNFAKPGEQSPLLKCLLQPKTDIELFERLLAVGISQTLSADEKNCIVASKLKKVIEWRTLLDNKFVDRLEDRKFCLLCLGHLISAHYSGKAQSLGAIEWTLIRLSNAIADKKPIIFTFCFGGYKSHTSPSHPEVDWAELFNLNYLVSYLYPVIKGYQYGVEIEYESEEVSIQFNNVPQEQTDRYTASFKKLLDYYTRKSLSKYGLNLTLRLVIARGLYKEGVSKLYELMEEKKAKYRKIFDALLEGEKAKWIQRAASNYMWDNGIVKYANLSESERYEIIKEARINNEAFLEADYDLRGSWFEYEYRIPLTGTWGRMPSAQPIDGWLHLKSTAASVVDCWIGTGFLETRDDNGIVEYRENILSKSQIESLEGEVTYIGSFDEELKLISQNFNKIPVFIRKN
ncbi:MAG: hypothetical protein WC229_01015 [Candidatus Paceibacterota bacterium]|jgi:hypothetical protein